MYMFLALIIAYLLGSINSAILTGRLWKNIDIRDYGSGNAGATNVLRTLGKTAAIVVLIVDALKGVISVVIGRYIAGDMGTLLAGFGAVVGHNYPVYFGFKGGKGILTSAAVIFMVDWKIGLILLIVSIGIMSVTKYVSLGSVVGALLYPILVAAFYPGNIQYIIFALCLGLLAIYRHKANISRLLNGTESKLGAKVKVKEE